MSSETKPFPPSELKLERLRREGAVPFSRDVLTIGTILGVIVGFWILSINGASSFYRYSIEIFSQGIGSEPLDMEQFKSGLKEMLRVAVEHGMMLLVSFVVPVLTFVLLLGLLQTKFLISFETLKPDVTRFFSIGNLAPMAIARQALKGCVLAIKAIAWVFVSLLLLRYVLQNLVASPYFESGSALEFAGNGMELTEMVGKAFEQRIIEGGDALREILFFSLGFAFMLGLASFFARVFQFQREHRMSRAEVEDEYREMEAAPEFKTALRERTEDSFS
jgi:flagellar biosynthetic protein FlhB